MNNRERKQLESAIAACSAAIEDYAKVMEMRSDQALGPPATAEQLAELEKTLGIALPPSYRNFMLLHNGWKYVLGDTHLLSVQELHDPKVIESIEKWRELTRDGKPKVADAAVVIGASPPGQGHGIIYLDKTTLQPDGEMDIVSFDGDDGTVIDRARNMVAFLKSQTRTLRALIKDEEE
jgi:cell wall assembly regulator SMI1